MHWDIGLYGAMMRSGRSWSGLPGGETELVLTTRQQHAPNWLVACADEAVREVEAARGRVLCEPVDIPVGRVAVVADPFGNTLVLLDLPKGRYVPDEVGMVTEVEPVVPQRAPHRSAGKRS